MYYFNARYYDATIGRFINVDPIQDGTNWYVYCGNNPLSFVDPTGLMPNPKGAEAYKSFNSSMKTEPKRTYPLNNPVVKADFQDHKNWKSKSPGTDTYSNNPITFATNDGNLTYHDSGDKGYGWHAKISYENKDGKPVIETIGHMQKPTNSEALVERGAVPVKTDDIIGVMSNTGDVYTYSETEKKSLPVTDKQRDDGKGTHSHHDIKEGNNFVNPEK